MSKLVIRREFYKKADEYGDGPSFEQQFGILANAVVVDKCPRLDKSKLAFQLIDKKDDNTKACGVCVYKLGSNIIFIPVFYAQGDVIFCNVLYKVKQRLFVPCTDAWLTEIENEQLNPAGALVDESSTNRTSGSPENTDTVGILNDPIVKSACWHFKGMMQEMFGKRRDNYSVLDTVIGMGKKACEQLMDKLTGDRTFLNAALHFYDANSLNTFAKTAALHDREHIHTMAVTPFSNESYYLDDDEREIMRRDGFIIKTARKDLADIIRKDRVKECFKTLKSTGKFELLTLDGNLESQLVVNVADMHLRRTPPECAHNTRDDADDSSARYMHATRPQFAVLEGDHLLPVSNDTIVVSDGSEGFTPSMLQGHGKLLSSSRHDLSYPKIACPDGTVYQVNAELVYNKGCWYSVYESDGDKVVVLGDSPTQKAPIVLTGSVIFPAGSRVLTTQDMLRNRPKIDKAYVRWGDFDVYINKYLRKNYRQIKITSAGSDITLTDDKGEQPPVSVKEASLKLVDHYGITPGNVRTMLHSLQASGHADTCTYLVEKKAALDSGWEDSPIGYKSVSNDSAPTKGTLKMPSNLEDSPEQLTQAVTSASEAGIKEVFDVSVIKLLLENADLAEAGEKDMKMFLRMLDNMCRKMLVIRWQIDNFKSLWGDDKVNEILANLKKAMDSLSVIVLFFKQKYRAQEASDLEGDPAAFLADNGDE